MPANSMLSITLSLLMLAGFALGAVGVYLLAKRPGHRKQAWLMIAAALVMFANVAVWLVPV